MRPRHLFFGRLAVFVSLMALVGLAIGSSVASAGTNATPSGSAAATSVPTLGAHDAHILLTRIESDAKRAGGSSSAEVHTEAGCCGVRVLTVLYRARPSGSGHYGAYVVQLVTGSGGTFTSARLMEMRTPSGYHYGGTHTTLIYQFSLAKRGGGNWGMGTFPSNDVPPPGAPPLAPDQTKLTVEELERGFSEALIDLKKAEARAPVGPISHTSAAAASAGNDTSSAILINEGIGSVRIGQTVKQIEQEAGKPTSKTSVSLFYDSTPPYAEVSFKDKHVTYISLNSDRDKTSKGIGEGSSKLQVQAAYPEAACRPQPGPGGATNLTCKITKRLSGGKTIATSFEFSTADGSGGVNSVYISDF